MRHLVECPAMAMMFVKSDTSSDSGGFVVVESKMMQVIRRLGNCWCAVSITSSMTEQDSRAKRVTNRQNTSSGATSVVVPSQPVLFVCSCFYSNTDMKNCVSDPEPIFCTSI